MIPSDLLLVLDCCARAQQSAIWPSCFGASLSSDWMACYLRNGAKRGFATTAQEKQNRPSNGSPCERDHEVGGGQRYFGFSYRERESRDQLLLVAHGDQTDEFAGLVEVVFEIDRAVGVDLGRQVKDRDGLKILL